MKATGSCPSSLSRQSGNWSKCSPFFSAPYDQSLSLRSSLSSWSLSDLLMLLLLASLLKGKKKHNSNGENTWWDVHTHFRSVQQSVLNALHWPTCGWQCDCCCVPCRGISPSAGRSERLLSIFCSLGTRTLCFSTDCTLGQICLLLADPQFLEDNKKRHVM